MKHVLAAALILAAPASARAQGDADGQRQVYAAAVHGVAGVRAKAPLGERSGTAVVLSADGLLLTSYAVVPDGSTNIRVWLHGPRLLTAEIVACSKPHELTLLRVKPRGELKPIDLGDSDLVKVGDTVFTLGNASNSIIDNDAASFAVGIVSAMYRLDAPRANSTYVGPVIESTAAVNPKIEGGPLLDAKGRMVGFLTMNYSPHRFLGTAIPINLLKPVIKRLKETAPATGPDAPVAEDAEGWIGLKVKDQGGRAVVASVDAGSPAQAKGFAAGMAITAVGGTKIASAADYAAAVKGLKAGSTLFLTVEDAGIVDELSLVLEKRP